MQRHFGGLVVGIIKLTGTENTTITCPLVSNVTIDSTCNITMVRGSSWSSNQAIVIDGQVTIIMGCRMANTVTINSTATGYYIGNWQTVAGFTNNSAIMQVFDNHVINFPIGAAALPGFTPLGDPDTGFWQRTANVLTASFGGSDTFEISSVGPALGSAQRVRWGDATTISGIGAFDTGLTRKAAGVVEVNNGTPGTTQSLKAYPVTDADALQTATLLRAGTGAPNNANGANGDIYFRSDGGALSTVYQRRAGAWVGIV
jgi:hypothetical protein